MGLIRQKIDFAHNIDVDVRLVLVFFTIVHSTKTLTLRNF